MGYLGLRGDLIVFWYPDLSALIASLVFRFCQIHARHCVCNSELFSSKCGYATCDYLDVYAV